MPRPSPWRDQDDVETDIPRHIVRVFRKPRFRRRDDPSLRTRGDGFGRVIQPFARLDLDEDQQIAAPGNDIDFAHAGAKAARDDAIAFDEQQRRRLAFRRQAEAKGGLPPGADTVFCRRFAVWISPPSHRFLDCLVGSKVQRHCCKFARNRKSENRAPKTSGKLYLLKFQCSYLQPQMEKHKKGLQIVENLTADEQYRT
jgi:hypothetical protein